MPFGLLIFQMAAENDGQERDRDTMTRKMYKVILTGKSVNNKNLPDVKQRMARLFKTSMPVIDKLFAREKAVVKRGLTEDAAHRYISAIQKAGAECYAEEMAPGPAAESGKNAVSLNETAGGGAEQDARQDQDPPQGNGGPRVIPVQTSYKPEDRFSPQPAKRLSASPAGLDLGEEAFRDVHWERIAALAAYIPDEGTGDDDIRFLLFIDGEKRPFLLDAKQIDYSAFQDSPAAKTAAAFRGFLYFLCRQNDTMILEETTFDFLSGNTLPRFPEDKASKYATALGLLIEDGGEGDEG